MKQLTYINAILFIIFSFYFSASASQLDDCYQESDNRVEVSKCLDDKLSKAEDTLDIKVSEIRKKMEKLSKETNTIYPIRSFNLSQQAFLIYRKTNCDWLFDKTYPVTGSGDYIKDCFIRMTIDRILELEREYTIKPIDRNINASNKKNRDNTTEQTSYGNTKKIETVDNQNIDRVDNTGNESQTMQKVDTYEDDLPEACYEKPDQGECRGSFLRYYYYTDVGKCRTFIWGGCEGNVPFETMAECREACNR